MLILQTRNYTVSELSHMVALFLRQGKTVVYPTETAYGLGADPSHPRAVKKIFSIKHRSKKLILPVIVPSLVAAQRWCVFDRPSIFLARAFWPGPLTLVVPLKKNTVASLRMVKNLGSDTLALRVPSHPLCRKMTEAFSFPIISTSANISTRPSLYRPQDVVSEFISRKYQPDILIDGGNLLPRKSSTVVRMVSGEPVILREGAVSAAVLKKRLARFQS